MEFTSFAKRSASIMLTVLAVSVTICSGNAYGFSDKPIMRLGIGSIYSNIAFSPDGEYIAVGTSLGMVFFEVDTQKVSEVHEGYISSSIAFSPDGQMLALGLNDDTIKLWNPLTGSAITLEGHTGNVNSVAFSPDGLKLASGSGDSTIKLWNVQTGALITTLGGHTDDVNSVAFNHDGISLASGSDDGNVKVWDLLTETATRTLKGHIFGVDSVAFSPDGQSLAAGSYNSIKLWDVQTGTLTTLGGHTDDVNSVAFSPDGLTLASGSDDNTIKLWDVQAGSVITTLSGHTGNVNSVAFNHDGLLLASGSSDNTVKLWNVQTGTVIAAMVGHTSIVNSVAFSPDGLVLASGSGDDTIKLWNLQTGSVITLEGHTGNIYSVAFSPDGLVLASSSNDETVKLWYAQTGSVITTLEGHTGNVNSVAFSPDSLTLASGSDDDTILIWDTNIIQPILTEGTLFPQIGTQKTNFTFKVTYLDRNNNMPYDITVTIDSGNPKTMLPSNPGDNNCIDGKEYYYTAKLDVGEHNYVFAANNGFDDAIGDTSEHPGPAVTFSNAQPGAWSGVTNQQMEVSFAVSEDSSYIFDFIIKVKVSGCCGFDCESETFTRYIDGNIDIVNNAFEVDISGSSFLKAVYSGSFTSSCTAEGTWEDYALGSWCCPPFGPCGNLVLSGSGIWDAYYGSIALTAPNGEEVWCGGSSREITWATIIPEVDHIHLLYSTDSGANYQDIITSTPNDGTYEWTTPEIDLSTVRVKAIAKDSSNNALAADESDADFTIQLPQIGITPTNLTFNAYANGPNPDGKKLDITNPGCGTLNWHGSDDADWLFLSTDSGECMDETDEVIVSVDISASAVGLTYGEHNATIIIEADGASNTPQTVSVTLHYFLQQTYELELLLGWCLISLPLQPSDIDIVDVLQSIEGNYRSVWSYNANTGWSRYFPTNSLFSNLNEMESRIGYWIEMATPDKLDIEGSDAETATILFTGWNLAGFSSVDPMNVSECMESIENELISIWEYSPTQGWSCYVPDITENNSLVIIKPGKGYCIQVGTSCTWEY